ncbi:MAG: hypothetical protein RR766_06390 [Longicatena sp.]
MKQFQCKKTDRAAQFDQILLNRWMQGVADTQETQKMIEENNDSRFESTESFLNWAKSLGYRKRGY